MYLPPTATTTHVYACHDDACVHVFLKPIIHADTSYDLWYPQHSQAFKDKLYIEQHFKMVCVCVCVWVRACVHACMHACVCACVCECRVERAAC